MAEVTGSNCGGRVNRRWGRVCGGLIDTQIEGGDDGSGGKARKAVVEMGCVMIFLLRPMDEAPKLVFGRSKVACSGERYCWFPASLER